MNESQKSALLPVVVSAAALMISASIIGFAYVKAHPAWSVKSINVTGSVERLVDSDTVKWSVLLSQTVPPTDQAEAGRQLDKDRETFLAFLVASGIEKEAVSIQPMSLTENYTTIDFKTGQTGLTSYSANQVLVIESSKVSEIGNLAQSASLAMAEKKINLSTQTLEYYYSQLPNLKLELLTDATKNARLRGEAILNGGGGSLGPVMSADTGVFQVTAVNSADLSDYGTYDTTSPRKKVTAVVHATFELK